MTKIRTRKTPKPAGIVKNESQIKVAKLAKTLLAVHVSDVDRARAAVDGGADLLYFGGEAFGSVTGKKGLASWKAQWAVLEEISRLKTKIVLVLPRITRAEELDWITDLVQTAKDLEINQVLVGNLGVWHKISEIMDPAGIIADYSFNVFNHKSMMALYNLGATRVSLSPELTMEQVGQLAPKGSVECLVHGRLPLMVTDYCTPGALLGSESNCPGPCGAQSFVLQDRLGYNFPIEMDQSCRMHILNSKVLCMLDHLPKFTQLKVDVIRILATTLNLSDIHELTNLYHNGLVLAREGIHVDLPFPSSQRTTGHYFRGVL